MTVRGRWAALGAAAALVVGGGVLVASAASESSSAFVPITPCRLVDTRAAPDNVGPRAAPLGPNDTYVANVWGANGNCTIPSTATAVSLNVTFVNPTSGGYLTVYPADAATRPLTSSLNWSAGQAPGPNAVTTKVSATGAIAFYNLAGNVDLIADIVGYYEPTGASGGNAGGAAGPAGPKGPTGDRGATGPTGAKGPTGAVGATGPTGQVGVAGSTGVTAPSGEAFGRVTTTNSVLDDDPIAARGTDTAIAVGVDGYPVIASQDFSVQDLVITKCADKDCTAPLTRTVIADAHGIGWHPAITIRSNGNPIVADYNLTTGAFRAIVCANPACTASTVKTLDANTGIAPGNAGLVKRAASVAISAAGNPMFSYYAFQAQELRFVVCRDVNCTATGPVRVIDTAADDVGPGSSIAVGTNGFPIMSYWDRSGGNLSVAACQDVGCAASPMISTVDDGTFGGRPADVGQDSSLAIGVGGLPVISYYDATNFDLLLATCNDTQCAGGDENITRVDTLGFVGQFTSIAIAPSGNPVIAYYAALVGDLKLVFCNDPACGPDRGVDIATVLDSANDVGGGASMTLGFGAKPTISYFDSTLSAIKVAIVSRTAWTSSGWGR